MIRARQMFISTSSKHTRGVQYMHVNVQELKRAEGKRQTQWPCGRERVTYLKVTLSNHPSTHGNLRRISLCRP
ncbi:hypothetical protein OH76DRAFT_1409741 [Lentinus brumalis]|uniref:Uncharacterized protein n=1 Tax=Lentinus brumalis TaxID=2498619 RepID=A0A371CU69_9APHY|nr:hypothetical protein OH76DRAFT_1409741 [Polyporus brumalis]